MNEMPLDYRPVIDEICAFDWTALDQTQLTAVAWAYYYFSIQFRENLEVAAQLHPDDPQLPTLVQEECDTENLSPWPDVAAPNEKLNHDEFMRRVLQLVPIDHDLQQAIEGHGARYLAAVRQFDDLSKAMSISSYEDGGLERVFTAMLTARDWETPLLQGFRHFLVKHIAFDANPDQGHGAMIRHLASDERIRPLWAAFRDLLVASVPRLA